MKKLFATLIAGLFAAVTFSAFAADPAPSTTDKPAVHKKHAKKHHKSEAAPSKPADSTTK